MPRRLRSCAAAVLLLATAIQPGEATTAYTYGPREYAAVIDGRAPGGRMTIAAHGKGEDSADDFHLYLTTAHGRRKPIPLPGIGPDETFDHGGQSYRASWSPDAHRVAVTFRIERHVLALRLYAIRHGRPQRIDMPDILRTVLGQTSLAADDFDIRTGTTVVTWLGPTRFRLDERRLLHGDPAVLLPALHGFGRRQPGREPAPPASPRNGEPTAFIAFAATVVCRVSPRERVRIERLKAGHFE
ncbi:hypothetical protein JQ557_30125 [Bradyrhizobium sp. U87765 SZCCT0131]|uniref:hypothetical protein n=1 Tax=unclassified Bradyrhizobium TaxID=2631580 RepID=UPI001BA74B73|nr:MULTISPECIES: hypothetical protein [unclassified Bradyrhizobium]MBR1222292.1 hypothetical protein [Bradyrhizobium sp. U87765 SZCCT0131]MBR1264224.1 hypothetical protein [Bradyrhizobium sp. U87765 SZCCT0134]MBR1307993.1 hypothetical protein [Bradyrhizobium sp. U87765 SZCCT0110]MBR1320474.1 hypothetical protein [Bradyrhizobium sp. U87765 SZCCT0109]MBR1348413.1 hypothetical protein [Bradyrhizobium sp. U87765 SZCCT0048]